MSEIKLPFGLNENNTLVHITDVENGKKCGCICPCCRVPLIAANKGKVRQHHFKHDFGAECGGGLESAIHLAAKQIIMEKRQIALPVYIASLSGTDSKGIKYIEQETVVKGGTIAHFNSVEEEIELHEMKADILARAGNSPLIIEIFYRHKVEDQKRYKMVNANLSAIEIDLSNITAEDVRDWDTFWSSINEPKRIKWLHNAKAQQIVSKILEDRLEKTLKEQERIYKAEEIKIQKQEQREKERLFRALNELQTLCGDRKYVERLSLEAETHPVWKRTRQYLPFSWHELPDFLSLDVPDGDWIFGCDRRIWQTAFYSYFICKNKKPFNVRAIDGWLQNTVGCKVPFCAETVGILGRKYPQLVPANISGNLPSSWRTLRTYFKHLCDLGMLEFSGDDWKFPGSCWYKVIGQDVKLEISIPGTAYSSVTFN
jgi:hypothetical protein